MEPRECSRDKNLKEVLDMSKKIVGKVEGKKLGRVAAIKARIEKYKELLKSVAVKEEQKAKKAAARLEVRKAKASSRVLKLKAKLVKIHASILKVKKMLAESVTTAQAVVC